MGTGLDLGHGIGAGQATMGEFDLTHPLPAGRTVLEASAGTGKTYSLTGLIVRYIAEAAVPAEQFLVVTFTRAAANELRDRTRETLDIAARTLVAGAAPATHPWMSTLLAATPTELAERHRRVVDAISRFDELTITTIHGFCQQSLGQLGVRAGNNPDAVLVDSINDVVAEVCRDEIITTLADDPTALNSPSGQSRVTNPAQAEAELKRSIGALMNNPGVAIVPTEADDVDPLAARWVELTTKARETVVQRQAGRGEIGYDTLISGMHDALTDARTGAAVAAQLAQRYAVVLVDEFQDTDRVQWDVFDRAFSTRTLITVGDPKQAIYRFRGADVHAYLDAVESAGDTTVGRPMVNKLGLAVNFRSDQALLRGLATMFDGATLGDPRIPFVPVRARDDAPVTAFSRDEASSSEPAVQLRIVPLDDGLRTKVTKEMAMPAVRSLVLADLVVRMIDVLDHGRLLDADAAAGTDWRPVRPGDIAVLVPSHAEANNVAEALRRARIPAVRTRTGSVLNTPAATQWRLLLAALAQPHQTAVVRAAALGWFLATDVAALVDDDTMLAALQIRAADLGDRLRAVGVSAFYDEQKAGPLVVGVLGHEGGERHLTDLDHISELLAETMQGRSSDPAQVLRVLDDLIADADERSEAAMRRIDSDALAVQITTIHSAKGLEYPIVMLPFGFKPRANLSTPYSYTASDGRRTIDFASKVAWDAGPEVPGDEATRQNQEMRRHLAGLDIEGDELRLLYVALTRAKHRLEIWWASTMKANTSALGRVLLDRIVAAEVQNTKATLTAKKKGFKVDPPPFHDLTDVKAIAQVQAVAQYSDGAIGATVIPATIAPAVWGGRRARATAQLTLAAVNGRRPITDRRWQRWSFSRLGSVFEAEAISSLEPVDREVPVDDRGGFDEPAEAFDELAGADEAIPPAAQLQFGIGPVAHLADVPGGTRFGTFVHSVLEQLAFNSPTLDTDIRALVLESAAREGLDLGVETPRDTTLHDIIAGLVAAVRTPLGPLFGGRTLADFDPRDRLPELTFDMPIASATGTMTAGTIGEVLLANLSRTDPVRPFAASLAGEFARFDISGWMNGSIDGVFRVPADDTPGNDTHGNDTPGSNEHRYVIVDYKTNRLHQPGAADPVAAYHPKLLIPAMEHSRYPLQALLYSVALHRYLRWRLGPAYDPAKHLGGTAYLFVRGMVGPNTPVVRGVAHGVFSWHPPAGAIIALDRLFAEGQRS